jgi:hypothetical protein
MFRVSVIAFLTASTLAFGALAQDIPGQLPDVSTYKGSMEQQRRDTESAAQVQAQNQAMQQRLDANYAAYAPQPGAGGGPPRMPPLKSKPLLPAAKNPLLGMWRMGATRAQNAGVAGQLPGVSTFVTTTLGGICESVLGKPDTVIRFTPAALNWVAPDGHDEILNHVEYRSDGANIIVIPTDSDLALIFGMPNHDNAVAAFFGCAMSRTNTSTRLGQTASASGASGGPAPAAAAASPNQAILNLTVGGMLNGTFASPPAGTQIYVTTKNPDVALAQAGFAGDSGGPPVEKLFAACKSPAQGGVQANCTRGMTAMFDGALGAAAIDPNGHAQTPGLPPGHYYLVGFTPYQGHALLWHLPVDLRPGVNSVALTPQNGSTSH